MKCWDHQVELCQDNLYKTPYVSLILAVTYGYLKLEAYPLLEPISDIARNL